MKKFLLEIVDEALKRENITFAYFDFPKDEFGLEICNLIEWNKLNKAYRINKEKVNKANLEKNQKVDKNKKFKVELKANNKLKKKNNKSANILNNNNNSNINVERSKNTTQELRNDTNTSITAENFLYLNLDIKYPSPKEHSEGEKQDYYLRIEKMKNKITELNI